jgi:hypothetical protein
MGNLFLLEGVSSLKEITREKEFGEMCPLVLGTNAPSGMRFRVVIIRLAPVQNFSQEWPNGEGVAG